MNPNPRFRTSERYPNEWPQALALHLRSLAERYVTGADAEPHGDVIYALRGAAEVIEVARALAQTTTDGGEWRRVGLRIDNVAERIMLGCKNALPYGVDMTGDAPQEVR